VLVVTLNYRLAALGFLAHPALRDTAGYPKGSKGTTGNWGSLDQSMALHWVKNNIAAFGGDPDKIAIHGQSAGGSATFMQLLLKRNAGVFRAAVVHSGDGMDYYYIHSERGAD
jgi:para-nitrobenzyl esterase